MKGACYLLGLALLGLILTIQSALGQAQKKPPEGVKEYIDQDIKRHRWELNVNAGWLFKFGYSGTCQYPYLVKFNTKLLKNDWGRAWRLSISPEIGNADTQPSGDTLSQGSHLINDYNFKPFFAIGHEWQKVYGRTMLTCGVDFAGTLQWSKGTAYDAPSPLGNGVSGTQTLHYRRHIIWLAAFSGAKFYLNHRVSASLESHLQFSRGLDGYRSSFEHNLVSRSRFTWYQMELLPCYFIGLSYNI